MHSFGWALAKNDVHEEPVGRRVVSADSLHPRDAPAPIHTGEVDHQVDRKRDGLADAGDAARPTLAVKTQCASRTSAWSGEFA